MTPGDSARAAADIAVRPATPDDVPALLAILNRIIEIGGTTAIEQPLTEQDFRDWFLKGPGHVCCHAALAADGTPLGFQSLERQDWLPQGWVDIATFARVEPRTPGVGMALFPHTRAFARRTGVAVINATIRADNAPGLAYYRKIGFRDYAVDRAVPLAGGTPVDRIRRRYDL